MTSQDCHPAPSLVVTAAQMQAIEGQLFAAGMPVAALMEKVAGRIAAWLVTHFPQPSYPRVGILVGPGHNGGDALVIGRELFFGGYQVQVCSPFERHKPLTADHLRFVQGLGISISPDLDALANCDLRVDGLFGFGLERPIQGDLAQLIGAVNADPGPVVSIDLPSGLHTDTGAVLGTALRATHTLCLGLWKRAFCQDDALAYLGQTHLIDFNIPAAAVEAGLGHTPRVQRMTVEAALARLPLPRAPSTHKYQVGQLLAIAGSRQYIGAALLTGLGARASGVGMLTLVVPESLRLLVAAHLPEALVVGCAETETGAIAHLPNDLDLTRYNAIACGPGLSQAAGPVVDAVLASPVPLVLDADGLTLLAAQNPITKLLSRSAPTLLTPHPGEFKRLFPGIREAAADAGAAAQTAATQAQAVVLLKGACTAIAHPDGRLWYIPESTPALARGGSGDILTGLTGGLLAQLAAADSAPNSSPHPSLNLALDAALVGAWWHGQAARLAAAARTELGVEASQLAAYLNLALAQVLAP
ncbi:MAG: NAD(P)H-hydrate dehydratase [Nodosilinea sp.]